MRSTNALLPTRLGRSETTIQLRQARTPTEILQAKLEIITATTITFSFVGVKDTGGLPIRAYAVQYKEERVDWDRARNKTWAVGGLPAFFSNFSLQP
uniref:Uncharacterized protein n=1 Tax=Timema cristinae TaxID=61476 RepID=A0A7R9HCU0_TIMCR|nr:unnamed protein product [Timema cristinae]